METHPPSSTVQIEAALAKSRFLGAQPFHEKINLFGAHDFRHRVKTVLAPEIQADLAVSPACIKISQDFGTTLPAPSWCCTQSSHRDRRCPSNNARDRKDIRVSGLMDGFVRRQQAFVFEHDHLGANAGHHIE